MSSVALSPILRSRRLGWLMILATTLVAIHDPHGQDGGSVIVVPTQVATIQQAIDLAADGDHIVVLPGRHPGPIDYKGKALRITGIAGAAETIIDGEGLGSTVSFISGERETSVLTGFTITGGTGTGATEGGGLGVGGGLYILDAKPRIQCCTIAGNAAESGGGVFVSNAAFIEEEGALFSHCRITKNRATSRGGGIFLNGRSVLIECEISGNVALSGGGFSRTTCAPGPSLIGVIVADNEASSGGGGSITGCGSSQGAHIEDMTFVNNRAHVRGGALALDGFNDTFFMVPYRIERSAFIGNESKGDGGAIYADLTRFRLALTECAFLGNKSHARGGAVWLSLRSFSAEVADSTFADNRASIEGGAMFTTNLGRIPFPLTFEESVVWGNGVLTFAGVGDPEAFGSLVDVEIAGEGNVSEDPLFWDPLVGDYALTPGSPAEGLGATGVRTEPWSPLGRGLLGARGVPTLSAGSPSASTGAVQLSMDGAASLAPGWLIFGFQLANAPMGGGTLVPTPDLLIPLMTDERGRWDGAFDIPPSLPHESIHLQGWIRDACTSGGFAATRGLKGAVDPSP